MDVNLRAGWYQGQWKYDTTVTDIGPRGTGLTGEAKHYDSKNGAIQNGVWDLFNKLDMTNETADCNCRVVQLPSMENSTCALRVGTCYYFVNSGDVQTLWSHSLPGHPAYFSRAYGHPGQESDSGNATWYNATAALTEATKSLFKSYPSLAKDCLSSDELCVLVIMSSS